jgi:hypothetical protein
VYKERQNINKPGTFKVLFLKYFLWTLSEVAKFIALQEQNALLYHQNN